MAHSLCSQDDSALNRKIMGKIIGSADSGPFVDAVLLEADDGLTALDVLRSEMAAGRQVHFVLMDFVMVT